MKQIFIAVAALFVILSSSVAMHPATVSAAKGGSDVQLQQDGDVMFLTTTTTTETNQTTQKKRTTKTPLNAAFSTLLEGTGIEIPQGFADDIGTLINGILSFVMVIAALLVFSQLILGGLYWITSGGDKGKIESAKQRLFAAVVGLIVLASSFAILTIALNFLGFESLNEVFSNTRSISE